MKYCLSGPSPRNHKPTTLAFESGSGEPGGTYAGRGAGAPGAVGAGAGCFVVDRRNESVTGAAVEPLRCREILSSPFASRAVTESVYGAGPGLCTSKRSPFASSTPFSIVASVSTLLQYVQYVPVTTLPRMVSM